MNKSKSNMSFSEFTCRKRDLHNFGNDWGLFIDIERNYRKMYFKKKHCINGIYIVQVDYDNENNNDDNEDEHNNENKNINISDIESNINDMYDIDYIHDGLCDSFVKVKNTILNNIFTYGITIIVVSILTFCILFVL